MSGLEYNDFDLPLVRVAFNQANTRFLGIAIKFNLQSGVIRIQNKSSVSLNADENGACFYVLKANNELKYDDTDTNIEDRRC